MEEKRWCMESPVTDLLGFIRTGDERGHVTPIILLLPDLTADVTLIRQMGKQTSLL